MGFTIKWSKRAINQLDEVVEYIENDSQVNAEQVAGSGWGEVQAKPFAAVYSVKPPCPPCSSITI